MNNFPDVEQMNRKMQSLPKTQAWLKLDLLLLKKTKVRWINYGPTDTQKRTICIEGGKKVDNYNLQNYEKLGDITLR